MAQRIQRLDIVIWFILTFLSLLILYPFYNAALVSLVPETTYMREPFMIVPKNATLDAYTYILHYHNIWTGYQTTLIITVAGTLYSMLLTVPLAYGLAKKRFPGRGLILNFIIFTLYFWGGLIPYYLLIRNLRLMNSIWSMVLPAGVNTFNFLITRNYFRTIPESLEESAKIDGANEIYILIHIIIPLAKPVLMVVALFYAVDRWNEWFNGMLFIRDVNKQPLQLVLRTIIGHLAIDKNEAVSLGVERVFRDGVKMAAIFVSTIPVMCVYPFVQKYFVRGIMLGAIKE